MVSDSDLRFYEDYTFSSLAAPRDTGPPPTISRPKALLLSVISSTAVGDVTCKELF
jgi:hypothetical protein